MSDFETEDMLYGLERSVRYLRNSRKPKPRQRWAAEVLRFAVAIQPAMKGIIEETAGNFQGKNHEFHRNLLHR